MFELRSEISWGTSYVWSLLECKSKNDNHNHVSPKKEKKVFLCGFQCYVLQEYVDIFCQEFKL